MLRHCGNALAWQCKVKRFPDYEKNLAHLTGGLYAQGPLRGTPGYCCWSAARGVVVNSLRAKFAASLVSGGGLVCAQFLSCDNLYTNLGQNLDRLGWLLRLEVPLFRAGNGRPP